MTDIVELSTALVERVLPVITPMQAPWSVEWFKPDPIIDLPVLCVRAEPNRFVDYTTVPTTWFLRLDFFLSAVDQQESRLVMASITDQNGPMISALQSEDIDDTLWRLAPFGVVATVGRGWELIKEKRGTYLEANIGVQISAN